MTTNDDFDRRLSTWLSAHEWDREPERLLDEVLARTAQTPRRPAWQIPERWLSMSAITTRFTTFSPVPWRTLGLIALLVLGILGGLFAWAGAQPKPALPYGLAANGSLLYSADGDIVRRTSPDAAPAVIVAGTATDTDPILSRGGTQFSFLRHLEGDAAELWLAAADGSSPRRLQSPVNTFNSIEWSPQGDVLALASDTDPTAILLVRADGGASTRLDVGVTVEGPTFRPTDGGQLAFRGADSAGTRGIYLVNRDGSGLARLDLDPGFEGDPSYAVDREYYFNAPTWSPDGTRLLYYTLEPDPASEAGAGFRIHLVNVGASGSVESEQTLEFDRASDDELSPAWLPTGDGIVFQSLEGSTHTTWIAPMGQGADSAHYLSVFGVDWINAQVSPDGQQVIAMTVPFAGADPQASLVDLLGGKPTVVDLGVDVSWQRLHR